MRAGRAVRGRRGVWRTDIRLWRQEHWSAEPAVAFDPDGIDHYVHFDRVSFWPQNRRKGPPILDNMSAIVPTGRRVGLLAERGTGKSVIVNLIAGTLRPHVGSVRTKGTFTLPLPLRPHVYPKLSLQTNVITWANLLGIDSEFLLDLTFWLCELRRDRRVRFQDLKDPLKLRALFAPVISMEADCILIDNNVPVDAARFPSDRRDYVEAMLADRDLIMATSALAPLRQWCNTVAVLEGGHLVYYPTIEAGIAAFQAQSAARTATDAAAERSVTKLP